MKPTRISICMMQSLSSCSGALHDPELGKQTHTDYIEPIYAKGTSRWIYGESKTNVSSYDWDNDDEEEVTDSHAQSTFGTVWKVINHD